MQQTYTPLQKRRTIVLVSAVILTAVYWVLGNWYSNKGAYSKDLVVFHRLFGSWFKDQSWVDLWQYLYQFALTVLLFWVVPFLISKYLLRIEFSTLGLGLTINKKALKICAVAYTIIIVSTYFSVQNPQVVSEYPLSKLIGKSWVIFISYQSVYVFYFIAYEIFYRGYLQFGLKSENPRRNEIIGIILIQTVLTTLFHIGKPTPEILAAAVFGPLFGYMALRFNSIWYGMVIHFVMNIFIDYLSLKGLHLAPQSFF